MSNGNWAESLVVLNDIKKTVTDSNNDLSSKMNSTIGTAEEKPLDKIVLDVVDQKTSRIKAVTSHLQLDYTENICVFPSGTVKTGGFPKSIIIGTFSIDSDLEYVMAKMEFKFKSASDYRLNGLFVTPNISAPMPITDLYKQSIISHVGRIDPDLGYTNVTLTSAIKTKTTYYIHLGSDGTNNIAYCDGFDVYWDKNNKYFLLDNYQTVYSYNYSNDNSISKIVGSFIIPEECRLADFCNLLFKYQITGSDGNGSPKVIFFISKQYSTPQTFATLTADSTNAAATDWVYGNNYGASLQKETSIATDNNEDGYVYYVHIFTSSAYIADIHIVGLGVIGALHPSVDKVSRGISETDEYGKVTIDIPISCPSRCKIDLSVKSSDLYAYVSSITADGFTIKCTTANSVDVIWQVTEF